MEKVSYLLSMVGRTNTDLVLEQEKQLEKVQPKLKKPSMYKVVLLNDDYTPMDFVVEVLENFFAMRLEQATQVMLQVHHQGKGICGVFTKDIAETKAALVNDYAREHEHPLLCEVEINGI